MRKLFRFRYEKCNKTCYAWCQKLTVELRKLDTQTRQNLVSNMVKAHDRLCDNSEYSFGLDVDEKNNLFVSHFRTPQKTELYSSRSFHEAVDEVCKDVMSTEIPRGVGSCVYGDNGAENLGQQILHFCTDLGFEELKGKHCKCEN